MILFIIGFVAGWIVSLLYWRYVVPIFTSKIDAIPRTVGGKEVKPVEVKR